jgi:hypothetical protein
MMSFITAIIAIISSLIATLSLIPSEKYSETRLLNISSRGSKYLYIFAENTGNTYSRIGRTDICIPEPDKKVIPGVGPLCANLDLISDPNERFIPATGEPKVFAIPALQYVAARTPEDAKFNKFYDYWRGFDCSVRIDVFEYGATEPKTFKISNPCAKLNSPPQN